MDEKTFEKTYEMSKDKKINSSRHLIVAAVVIVCLFVFLSAVVLFMAFTGYEGFVIATSSIGLSLLIVVAALVCFGYIKKKTDLKAVSSRKALIPYSINDNEQLEKLMEAQTRRKILEYESEKYKTKLYLIKKQMDTHFIINTLVGAQVLIEKSSYDEAKEMIDALSSIIRHFNMVDRNVNIFSDLEIIEAYVSIMNIRYKDKFCVYYEVDDKLSAYVIPLYVLHPIVDNCLLHGLQNKTGQCDLIITGNLLDDCVEFVIKDNGLGIPSSKLAEIEKSLESTDYSLNLEDGFRGISLVNLQKRIKYDFGSKFGISITSKLNLGTTVTLRLPKIYDEDI